MASNDKWLCWQEMYTGTGSSRGYLFRFNAIGLRGQWLAGPWVRISTRRLGMMTDDFVICLSVTKQVLK
jgi:hypothetical protein